MRLIAVLALLAFGLFAFCGCGDGASPTGPTNEKEGRMEDGHIVEVSMTPDEKALFDRMQKVGEDPFVDMFQMVWSTEESDPNGSFSCMVTGQGTTYAKTGPRKEWRKTLATILYQWENTPEDE
ncbi:MAG: hypothetical protein KOO60_10915 [Gemmatimonadales bacterium]|nr:hypothetical protein [Gemmatimonadales bacterium]